MIDTVIFDIGRVLIEWDWKGYLLSFGFREQKREILAKAIFQNESWRETDRGVWSDEEILQSFIKEAPQYETDIRNMWEGMETCVRKCDYTDTWIEGLKARGYKVYYLSNYGKTLREKTKTALNFIKSCDGGLFSYQIKKIKPDPAIYEALVEKYSLVPNQCVFLDDMPENVEAAKQCGMHGILFTNYKEAGAELEQKLNNL